MRSTTKAPARVHNLSWHLMRGQRSRPIGLLRAAKLSQTVEATRLRCAAMYSATQAAATTAAVINAMWSNATKAHGSAADEVARAAGFREPPEAEPATQTAPRPPLRPAGGEARPMSLTNLPSGNVVLEIGDLCLTLNAEEAFALRTICASPRTRRGAE